MCIHTHIRHAHMYIYTPTNAPDAKGLLVQDVHLHRPVQRLDPVDELPALRPVWCCCRCCRFGLSRARWHKPRKQIKNTRTNAARVRLTYLMSTSLGRFLAFPTCISLSMLANASVCRFCGGCLLCRVGGLDGGVVVGVVGWDDRSTR